MLTNTVEKSISIIPMMHLGLSRMYHKVRDVIGTIQEMYKVINITRVPMLPDTKEEVRAVIQDQYCSLSDLQQLFLYFMK